MSAAYLLKVYDGQEPDLCFGAALGHRFYTIDGMGFGQQHPLPTSTVYDWNSISENDERFFETAVPATIPINTSVTIIYSKTDKLTGTVVII